MPRRDKPDPVTLRIPKESKDWLKDWSEVHCARWNKHSNVSAAIRQILEHAIEIDTDTELRKLIQDEFAGDYRFFVKRACEEYLARYKEAEYGQNPIA